MWKRLTNRKFKSVHFHPFVINNLPFLSAEVRVTYLLFFFRIPLVVNSEVENIKLKVLSVLKSDCSNSMNIITLMVSHIAKFQGVIVTKFKRILGFEQIRSRVELVVQTFAEIWQIRAFYRNTFFWEFMGRVEQSNMHAQNFNFFFFIFRLGVSSLRGKKVDKISLALWSRWFRHLPYQLKCGLVLTLFHAINEPLKLNNDRVSPLSLLKLWFSSSIQDPGGNPTLECSAECIQWFV